MDLRGDLEAMFDRGKPGNFKSMTASVTKMPPKAYRFVAEMEEIAATLAAVGLSPKFHEGAADIYSLVASTSLGEETVEARSKGETIEEIAAILADALKSGAR
jgi:hypothetical protein